MEALASLSWSTSCPCKRVSLRLSSFTAAEYGDVESLQKRGPICRRAADTSGQIPLTLAAQHGRVEATSWLIQTGSPLFPSFGSQGATPLHRACFSGAVGAIKVILDHLEQGNDRVHGNGDVSTSLLLIPDTSFGDWRTPLHKAVAGGRYLAVCLLLDFLKHNQPLMAATLSAVDSEGQTPLQLAMECVEQESKNPRELHSSVLRWDMVAGGPPDWSKCAKVGRTVVQTNAVMCFLVLSLVLLSLYMHHPSQ